MRLTLPKILNNAPLAPTCVLRMCACAGCYARVRALCIAHSPSKCRHQLSSILSLLLFMIGLREAASLHVVYIPCVGRARLAHKKWINFYLCFFFPRQFSINILPLLLLLLARTMWIISSFPVAIVLLFIEWYLLFSLRFPEMVKRSMYTVFSKYAVFYMYRYSSFTIMSSY